ncbi:uncharacterized protein ASPGLDRAFT_159157, partial [Aspergillus glaucus CBS 516.65]
LFHLSSILHPFFSLSSFFSILSLPHLFPSSLFLFSSLPPVLFPSLLPLILPFLFLFVSSVITTPTTISFAVPPRSLPPFSLLRPFFLSVPDYRVILVCSPTNSSHSRRIAIPLFLPLFPSSPFLGK